MNRKEQFASLHLNHQENKNETQKKIFPFTRRKKLLVRFCCTITCETSRREAAWSKANEKAQKGSNKMNEWKE